MRVSDNSGTFFRGFRIRVCWGRLRVTLFGKCPSSRMPSKFIRLREPAFVASGVVLQEGESIAEAYVGVFSRTECSHLRRYAARRSVPLSLKDNHWLRKAVATCNCNPSPQVIELHKP